MVFPFALKVNSYVGGSGNGYIHAANGRGQKIDCGSGREQVRADRSGRLRDCERIYRLGRAAELATNRSTTLLRAPRARARGAKSPKELVGTVDAGCAAAQTLDGSYSARDFERIPPPRSRRR